MALFSRIFLIILVVAVHVRVVRADPVLPSRFQVQVADCDSERTCNAQYDIVNWSKNAGYAESQLPTCSCMDRWHCYLDVKESLPKNIISLITNQTTEYGPNCFNFAMYASGLTSTIGHATDVDIVNAIAGAKCEKIEPLLAASGDIGVIDAFGEPTHAFVYLSPKIVLEKERQDAAGLYRVVTLRQSEDPYPLDEYNPGDALHVYRCPRWNGF